MLDSMYIGSGDVTDLLAKRNTKGFAKLMTRFTSGEKPNYNALASPVDALRTGAILENILAKYMEDFYTQWRVESDDMDVFRASLDFARLENKRVVEFIELKTIGWQDWGVLKNKVEEGSALEFVKKKYKNYYNQVQEQLYCTGLDSAYIRFLIVYSYVDEENYMRELSPSEWIDILILRDNEVIDEIKNRGKIFQLIKWEFTNNK